MDEDVTLRLAALEAEVAALRAEVGALRSARGADSRMAAPPTLPLMTAPRQSFSTMMHDAAPISGDEIESYVGRYGTLALAALVILMAVGAVIRMAVARGLITPEVRVIAGALVAAALGGAGMLFRRRGEVRYGGVLLALALAVVDLVAWGAGPRFHLVPTPVALVAVNVVAIGIAVLALRDRSEFLFTIAVAGALAAPFVTADEQGSALTLLAYGAVVLAGALRAARDPDWMFAAAIVVVGAAFYTLASAAMPAREWYGPVLPALFCTVNAAAALVLGGDSRRGELARAQLSVASIGVMLGWDALPALPVWTTAGLALALAALTYAALAVRTDRARRWRTSAVMLPFVSLYVAYSATYRRELDHYAVALWTAFALGAWLWERQRGEQQKEKKQILRYAQDDTTAQDDRAGAHLLAAAILGGLAITAWLWSAPLLFVVGLASWAVAIAWLAREEPSRLPVAGVGLLAGSAILSALDQLVSRGAYSYVPFWTRSSASAAAALVGTGMAGWALAQGSGAGARLADRPVRLGAAIGFAIVWGRMEVAHAFSPDVGAFLLTSYYAACGVGSIIAGRALGIGKLRVAGLALAVYAAIKAIIEVTNIGSVGLRVGAYAAVGVFLLFAGYLYREARAQRELRGPGAATPRPL